MSAPSLTVDHATLIYNKQLLFDRLSFFIPAQKWTCILGQSGIGKTSLLRVLAGLSSDVVLSHPIQTSDSLPLTHRISYIAQQDQLLPWLTILDNVCLGYKLRAKADQEDYRDRAQQLLERVGLKNIGHLYPSILSGGMRQRVLLARTLLENKSVVLLDEPFAALDAITRYTIQDLAAELLSECTVVLVTHDPLEALRLGHQILIMSGRPANLDQPITLASSVPRDIANPELLRWQSEIVRVLKYKQEDICFERA